MFHSRQTIFAAGILTLVAGAAASAVSIDTRPLKVGIVPAVADLKWPDELSGADAGVMRLIRPLIVTGAGDGSRRLFLATQHGTIHVVDMNNPGAGMKTFLDIRKRVHYVAPQDNEEGFLGLAFHPRYADNGEFFVYYTNDYQRNRDRRAIISRFRVSQDDPDRADPASEQIVLAIDEPYWNHNGGTIIFGPDGFLYAGVGDGGFRDDPHMNGQNLQSLLAKILRIDVDGRSGDRHYAIPPDNPFVTPEGRYARGEIWAYGVRNPWRIAFDRQTGDLWCGDVGQDDWEEIDLIVRGGNYGWNLREGRHQFGPFGGDARDDLIEPLWDYDHDVGKSITGGVVYRGKRAPQLAGAYLYADYVSGKIWGLWYDRQTREVSANRELRATGAPVTTFGEDDDGEVYFTTEEGGVWTFQEEENRQ